MLNSIYNKLKKKIFGQKIDDPNQNSSTSSTSPTSNASSASSRSPTSHTSSASHTPSGSSQSSTRSAHTSLSPTQIKKKQIILAFIIFSIVMVILAFVMSQQITTSKAKKSSIFGGKPKTPVSETKVETVGSNIKPEEVWRYKMTQDGKKLKSDIDDLKLSLKQNFSTQEELIKSKDAVIDQLKNKLTVIEDFVAKKDTVAPTINQGIQKISLQLSSQKQSQIETTDTTIPAGSFAKAVLLSGVDASTSLSSSSDPMPILVRITSYGTLPRQFKSDLKDCHVIAGGYGDISSERVYARLEKMSCIERATGEIIETEVAGFIAGEDGKVGLRGTVVAKESIYLANSLLGGVVGGLSHTFSPERIPPLISSGSETIKTNEKFKYGFGEGMSNSMDRLSKYYIDRAESLQPVIEISAGRVVDIVFTEKTKIGTTKVKQELANKRDQKRMEAARSIAEADRFSISQNINQEGL